MTSQQGRWDSNRGLSPVIGTVFLVAIAVVLAAVVGSVLSVFQTPAVSPTAAFDVTLENEQVTITHTGGDTIDPAQLSVVYGGSVTKWNAIESPSSGHVSAGDSVTLSADATDELALRWTAPDGSQSQTLYSSFIAPDSIVSVTDVTFESGYSGWSDQHLSTEGYSPEGHFREIHTEGQLQFRDAETAPSVTDSTSVSQAASGTTRSFTLQYDGSTFTYTVDGRTLTTSAVQIEENAIAVMAKNRHASVDAVTVTNIQLNGNDVGTDLDVSTGDKAESIIIEADGIKEGFELTGDVTYTYTGTPDDENEAIGIRIEVA